VPEVDQDSLFCSSGWSEVDDDGRDILAVLMEMAKDKADTDVVSENRGLAEIGAI